ncbi:hypothetical protein ACRALDRAFT_2035988 [Sodiomyces alcalophilus JCM 7366]|uniref:uncharacterized protein n=1 Tax=Sodiomyces alcalophilus JCM 7366 TaxID=591952 RepID=UPI0039B549B1
MGRRTRDLGCRTWGPDSAVGGDEMTMEAMMEAVQLPERGHEPPPRSRVWVPTLHCEAANARVLAEVLK